jgi:HAE1 family hydrophobic/amphiphilic exporter-1
LSTIPELKHITSTSKEEFSTISLTFEWGTNLDTRTNEVRDMVGMAKMLLPDDVEEPRVVKFNISTFPILVYGVTAGESYPKLEKLLKDDVADPLKRLPGVASSTVLVPLKRQINVDLDRERLAAYDLTPLDVVRVIARENANTPAGSLKMGLTDYLVRVPGEFTDVAPMGRIVVATRGGSVVHLSEVGTTSDSFKEVSRYITINGERAGILLVQKQSDANTVQVARLVRARMEQLKKALPPDVKIVNVMDSSEDIERAIDALSKALIESALMTMLVVVVFLRRWRATLVIGLTIPFSLILAVILAYFLGYTINMITLFGMIVAIGMVVDDAIVILEVIMRHREAGERPKEGAIYGASEVAMAVIASTATTVCILFPVLFVKGITRILFTDFAVTVGVALLASLFSALTLAPMLSSTLMRREKFGVAAEGGFFGFTERLLEGIYDAYSRILGWALNHRVTVVVSAAVFFFGSLGLYPFIGSEFMPEEDRAMLSGTVFLPVGTRVEETARVMDELARLLEQEVPASERIATYTTCGTSEQGTSNMGGEEGSHIGTFGVKLVPKDKRKRDVKQIAAALRERVAKVRGMLQIEKYRIETSDPMDAMLTGGEQPLTVNIIGEDLDATDRVAAQVQEMVRKTPGTVDVNISRVKGMPELWVRVDRDKASTLGLNVSDVGDTVRASIYGNTASKFRVEGDEYDIFVRLRESDRSDTRDVLATPVRLPTGALVRAQNVAALTTELGPLEIDRKDRGRIVNVTGNVDTRSLGEVAAEIQEKLKKLQVPRGVEVIMAGQTEQQQESFFWLFVALGVGVALVYMVMASQFESLRDPFVVMFSVPFGLTGAIWALFLAGQHINVIVFLGLLLLVGVVVKNAILLVDYTNVLRARGLEMVEAVRLAGRTRLRPVLMTALATMAGLAPMAFGKGQGSEVWNPLGVTVLGGLLVSTFVTLVLVPTIYSIFETHLKPKNGQRGNAT